jgi:alanyl-tRNA synthetase
MKIAAIRQAFIDYFEQHHHKVVPSSSLIPGNDLTLLFTNAGMVQFKDVFLGEDKRSYCRAVSVQRCVRAGGKHNDLENVGYTARHHTFFEMMGNFSFGDYFKHDAIHFAWKFLTAELGLPANKLWVTVHHSDAEAEKIWLDEIGIEPQRFSRLDEDNFWSMGDTGPCGPCSEIFYDHGPNFFGGPPGSPDEDGDRYIEIWNMVFMQYNRSTDGTMTPLPKPSIDTGMGLERIAAVLQGVHSNYEIDLFQNLISATASIVGIQQGHDKSLRVIADHIRSVAFLIVDDVIPTNEGRGYVLRRIIRRAIRHGKKMGAQDNFLSQLVAPLVKEMGGAYPELVQNQQYVEQVICKEEQQFAKTLELGMRIMEQDLQKLDEPTLAGATIFKLYDTYGFPVDLIDDIARERDLKLDMAGFEAAMQLQRTRARAASNFAVDYSHQLQLDNDTRFVGYHDLEFQSSVVVLLKDGEPVEQAKTGDHLHLFLDQTSFYAESGGQVGDIGNISGTDGYVQVNNTTKQGNYFIHHGVVMDGQIRVGELVLGKVDAGHRMAATLNHSATHLLHAVLRQVLGDFVVQKGSLVSSDRLRFDFSHCSAVTPRQLENIEYLVNEQIRANSTVDTCVMSLEEAKVLGAMALFGEKYTEQVRVVTMGTDVANKSVSVELCGGTHVKRSGDIGAFVIVSETGISAGVRRIEALTGSAALNWFTANNTTLIQLATIMKTSRDQVVDKVKMLMSHSRKMERDLKQLQAKFSVVISNKLSDQVIEVNGIKLLVSQLHNVDVNNLRTTLDQLKNKLGSGVVVLAIAETHKAKLVAGVTSDLCPRINAGALVRHTSALMDGKGGGRPEMAQGGGQAAKLEQALASVPDWLSSQLV